MNLKRMMIVLAAVSLAAAACSSSGDDGVATLSNTETTVAPSGDGVAGTADASDEEKILAFAACMRDNGVENFEDPSFDAEGNPQFNFRGQEGGSPFGDVDRETVRAATDACQDELEGLAFGPGSRDLTEIQDTLVEFAACMRDNGYDMPDPDFSNFANRGEGEGPGGGPFGDIDPEDPAFQTALEQCQDLFGNLGVPGGGGGRPGAGGGQPGGGEG